MNKPVHPLHYLLGMITHAPVLAQKWRHEPVNYKFSFGMFYLILFACAGYAIGDGSVYAAQLFSSIYVLTLIMFVMPLMLFDVRKGDWLYRLSCAFSNTPLLFHAYNQSIFLIIGFFAPIAMMVNMDPMQTVRITTTMSVAVFGLFVMQMAQAMHDHVKNWLVLTIPLIFMMCMYIGMGILMERVRTELMSSGLLY